MKRKLAVDMDDVLKEFNRALFAFYNVQCGTNHNPDEAVSYSLEVCWGCSKEKVYEILNLFYISQEHHNIPPLEGALEAIAKLEKYYDLYIITARASIFEEVTMQWINKHFPGIFKGVYFATTCPNGVNDKTIVHRPKSEICLEIGAFALIEDNINNALDAANAGMMVYLVNRPWNQEKDLPSNIIRVYSWSEILTHLT